MNFESCEINNIVIHDIGNKYEDGKLRLSESCFLPDDMDVHNLLKSYFLAPFKKDAYYRFAPIEDNLYHNLVYNAVNSIFLAMELEQQEEHKSRRVIHGPFQELRAGRRPL